MEKERDGWWSGDSGQEIQTDEITPTHHQKCPEREMLFIT
jgi:hypothetical protein